MKVPSPAVLPPPLVCWHRDWAQLGELVEVHVLDDGGETVCGRRTTDIVVGVASDAIVGVLIVALGVLDVEHGLLLIKEHMQSVAFVVLQTLLVDGPLHLVDDLRDNLKGVLEPNGQAACVSRISKEVHVVDAVIRGQTETIVVVVSVDIVWVNSVAAFLLRHVKAALHDFADVVAVDVDPVLSIPSLKATT